MISISFSKNKILTIDEGVKGAVRIKRTNKLFVFMTETAEDEKTNLTFALLQNFHCLII